MAIGDLPLMDALKTKMRWSQQRQRLLSENVANADTPGYRGHDLKQPSFDVPKAGGLRPPAPPRVAVAATSTGHLQGWSTGAGEFRGSREPGFEVTPNGNAVNLEEEMMKASENQIEYQAMVSLYQRSLGVLKTAIGRKG